MARKAKNTKISVSEFKKWLEGVQSMQEADWHPNAKQWSMIVTEINKIDETIGVVEKAPTSPTNNPAYSGHLHSPTPPQQQIQQQIQQQTPIPTGARLDLPGNDGTKQNTQPRPRNDTLLRPTTGVGTVSVPIVNTEDGTHESAFGA